MKRIFRKSFYAYSLTYAVYILLLLGIMGLYYERSIQYWQESKLDSYEAILKENLAEFKGQISNLSVVGARLEWDEQFKDLSGRKKGLINADYAAASFAQRAFADMMIPYSLVSDCGIYYGDNLILTRQRSYMDYQGTDEYYQKYFHVDNYTKDEWLAFLQNGAGLYPGIKVSSSGYGERESCIWKEPLSYGMLYAVMDANVLARYFLPDEIREQGYFYICDLAGTISVPYRYDSIDMASFWEIRQYDADTGLFYVIGIPKNYLDVLRRSFFSGLVVYVILLLTGGVLLALFFSDRLNRPMRSLVLSASSYEKGTSSREAARNGYEYLNGIMESLHTSLEDMDERLERQREEEKCHFLDMAVHGRLNSNKLIERFGELFPDFPERYRIVIIIFGEGDMESHNMLLSRNILVEEALQEFFSEDIVMTSTDSDTMLLFLPERTEKRYQKESGELRLFLEGHFQQQVHVVTSAPVSDILEVPSAYVAALCQFRAGTEKSSTADREAGNALKTFDFMYYQQLFEALSNGEEIIAMSLVGKIENAVAGTSDQFADRRVGEVVCRQIYIGSMSSLRNILFQVKINYFDILSDIYIPAFLTSQSMASLFEETRNCCRQICVRMKENRARFRKSQLHQQVMEFIDAHITDNSLSTQMAADHLHISDNTMQKIVRSVTGKTFYEYVEGRRIDRALHLLKKSDEPVESVALQCGFSSYNAMYKVFKRRYHLSPKMAAEKMDQEEY